MEEKKERKNISLSVPIYEIWDPYPSISIIWRNKKKDENGKQGI